MLRSFLTAQRVLVLLVLLVGPATAQKVSLHHVEDVPATLAFGPVTEPGTSPSLALDETVRFPGAAWLWLEFDRLVLDEGDFVRIRSLRDKTVQTIAHGDPQLLANDGYAVQSVVFGGDAVDLELHVKETSVGTLLELGIVRVAWYAGLPETICGPVDNRVLTSPVDPCVVRIVDSNGGWGTGFMISDNWMITANHVMTFGPWSVQRNVPASDADGSINPPANANDSFPLANALPGSMLSGSNARGNDWAVINVPNNAGGAPGAGCNPSFNCNYANTTANTALRVRGFGIDASPATSNGVQQDETGQSVAGGDNASHFRHRVDTVANNSGSPVTDDMNRIVGIHTHGGCLGDNPETGSNGGTLMTNPGLVAAIKQLCGENICEDKQPTITCTPAGSSDDGACIFNWTIMNPGPQPLTEFYVDLEAGSGAVVHNNIGDITPPPGFAAVFCYPWDGAFPSNWAVVCFMGGSIPPGGQATGSLTIDTNGPVPVLVQMPGWHDFVVPAGGIHCHVSRFNPTAIGLNCGNGEFGPHIIGQEDNWSPGGDWIWLPTTGSVCPGIGCPCGNDEPTAGCLHSGGVGGTLFAPPAQSIPGGLFVDAGYPAGNSSLLLINTSGSSSTIAVFDGVNCVNGGPRLLPGADNGVPPDAVPGDGIRTFGDVWAAADVVAPGFIAPGTSYDLQCWYRDVLCGPPPAPCISPCGSGANFTEARAVLATP